ncbi:lysosomal acid glucosylceramidase isoform X2 [Frankliniella occidentalis]|uniref:Glucosylceramidase n=1 Tax=Frankliniella occidentalis TaxID=133901 RepID=A0A6J1S5Q0_FRAOC|nr:lysosomal acid glucosylceramidase isoform X2 [Frankliniella occidentalis]
MATTPYFGRGCVPIVLLMIAVGVVAGAGIATAAVPCVKRSFGFDSFVCVCNSTYCDTLPQVQPAALGRALVYTTTKAELRFEREELAFTRPVDGDDTQTLTVNRSQTYQSVYGFGGAFTDAFGINLVALPAKAQELLLRSYFSPDGLEYNMGRVPIGGTDFSTRAYTYADNSTTKTLSSFALQTEDFVYKIPVIKRATKMRKEEPNNRDDLLLFSSIWSPPSWMKTSNDLSGFGRLKKEFYQMYADYFVRFLEAYEAQGISFHCVSTGNEPLNGIVPFKYFNSLGWVPGELSQWIRDHFGPTIRKSKFKDVKLLGHDDQRILLPWELKWELADKVTSSYIDIIGYHWYLNFITPSSILDSVHNLWPDKPIINTEACNGDKPWQFTRVEPGSWGRGEMYMADIIEVMNHWTTGWMDWNLALNREGGPTWAKNWVDAPIIVDANRGEFYKSPTYYALAHVAKFVPRNSVRVSLQSAGGNFLSGTVQHVAFLRPDGGVVVALVNKHNSVHRVTVRDPSRGEVTLSVPAKSFVTVVYW